MKRIILLTTATLTTATLIAAASLSAIEQSIEAKIYSREKFVRLRNGTPLYSEKEVAYHSFPEKFDGYRISVRNLRSEEPVRFKVKKAGLVRIAAAGVLLSDLRNDGWIDVGTVDFIDASGTIFEGQIAILEKNLNVGDYTIPAKNGGAFGARLLIK